MPTKAELEERIEELESGDAFQAHVEKLKKLEGELSASEELLVELTERNKELEEMKIGTLESTDEDSVYIELEAARKEIDRLKAELAKRSITPALVLPDSGPNKPPWHEKPCDVLAPESMIGCGVSGQMIGKDRKITVPGWKAAELVKKHGFEYADAKKAAELAE